MLTKDQRLTLLLSEVSKKYPTLTKGHLRFILEAEQDLQTTDLRTSRQIRIAGWGTFKVVDRAARTTRNPQTGQQMQVPARKAITFRAASELQQAVGAGKATRRPPGTAATQGSVPAAAPPKRGRRKQDA
jgi:DNA-binding protein HU-beta